MPGFPALSFGDINVAGGKIFTGAPNMLINKQPVATIGDFMTPHPAGPKKIHPPNPILTGSPLVLVNKRPIAIAFKSVETLSTPPHPWIAPKAPFVMIGI